VGRWRWSRWRAPWRASPHCGSRRSVWADRLLLRGQLSIATARPRWCAGPVPAEALFGGPLRQSCSREAVHHPADGDLSDRALCWSPAGCPADPATTRCGRAHDPGLTTLSGNRRRSCGIGARQPQNASGHRVVVSRSGNPNGNGDVDLLWNSEPERAVERRIELEVAAVTARTDPDQIPKWLVSTSARSTKRAGTGTTIPHRIRMIIAAVSVSLGPAPRRGPGMRGYDWVGNAQHGVNGDLSALKSHT
jgi:hypothetical protein